MEEKKKADVVKILAGNNIPDMKEAPSADNSFFSSVLGLQKAFPVVSRTGSVGSRATTSPFRFEKPGPAPVSYDPRGRAEDGEH